MNQVRPFFHYIISARNVSERRAAVIQRMTKWEIKPNFFNAIMGNELTKEELHKLSADDGLLTKGEIGCALSHLAIYEELLKSEEPYIYIFEDDAKLTDLFIELEPEIHQFMSAQLEPTVVLLFPIAGHKKSVKRIGHGVSIMRCLAGSKGHAYAINRRAAENLLKAQTPVKIELDAWAIYQKLNFIKLYCLNQAVAELDCGLAQDSIIDKIEERTEIKQKTMQRIKDQHIQNWYNQLPVIEKVKIQIHRLQRHIQELYYDKDKV